MAVLVTRVTAAAATDFTIVIPSEAENHRQVVHSRRMRSDGPLDPLAGSSQIVERRLAQLSLHASPSPLLVFLDEDFLAGRRDAVRNRDESKNGQERRLVVLAIEAVQGTVKPCGYVDPLFRVMTPKPLDRLINVR